jgi:hypothetical protein
MKLTEKVARNNDQKQGLIEGLTGTWSYLPNESSSIEIKWHCIGGKSQSLQ